MSIALYFNHFLSIYRKSKIQNDRSEDESTYRYKISTFTKFLYKVKKNYYIILIVSLPQRTGTLYSTIFFCSQISDIVVGQEPNVTAREALLRWARRSTARYPGVRVTDFTGSWRDGLAFSALLHRNRPDLVDWRTARSSQPRERLDRVFYVAEREYGVTRLLDPEGNDRLSVSYRDICVGYLLGIVARHL